MALDCVKNYSINKLTVNYTPTVKPVRQNLPKENLSEVTFGRKNDSFEQSKKSDKTILQEKLRQIVLEDAESDNPIIKSIKPDFISSLAGKITANPERNILIGVTGESGCGKTTICKKLQEVASLYDMPVEVLNADNYFKDISKLIKKYGSFDNLMKSGYKLDAPQNFQLALLRSDLKKLAKGEDIKTPRYHMDGTGVSEPKTVPVKSKKIIVVEGICSAYDGVRDVFDAKIYVEADDKQRKKLFIKRGKERNISPEQCLEHWDYVNASAKKYIRPAKPKADVVINGYANLDDFAKLFSKLNEVANNPAQVRNRSCNCRQKSPLQKFYDDIIVFFVAISLAAFLGVRKRVMLPK